MFSISSDTLALLGICITIITSVWALAWWLSGKFDALKGLFYEKIDLVGKMILDKLEYHERHDDARFGSINNDLWDIRVRNAARDGLDIEPRRISKPAAPI